MVTRRYNITGADLRAQRKAAGLTQAELAHRAEVCRGTVSDWERKDRVPLRWGAPAAIADVLDLPDWLANSASTPADLPENADLSRHNARAGGWGLTLSWQEKADAQVEIQLAAMIERQAQRLARRRVKCRAKTRAGGECRNKSEPGKRRCKFHGGKSTGPKTPEGKARIAEAQRRRWAKASGTAS